MNKKVCVIGLGYIGLPTSAMLASKGHFVAGVDICSDVVSIINKGKIHIIEPDLECYVRDSVKNGKLKASLTPEIADVFIIAVPTPFKDGYTPNIDYVLEATKSIAKYVRKGNIIILESTSPVGTTEKVEEVLSNAGVDTSSVYIAHCPERVLPGNIMKELVENDRIVGGLNASATRIVSDFYREFVKGKVFETDARTAEMAKLTENSFRDVNIAFANELSLLCDKLNINVWELIKLTNRHPRVNILNPGVGVGGHCIAVDPWFIVYAGGETAKLIKTSREINLAKTDWVIGKVLTTAAEFENTHGRKPVIACLGLCYKPDIDDLRESPAVEIVKKLIKYNMNIIVSEPNIKQHNNFELVKYDEAIKKADIIVYLVAHKEFKLLSIDNYLDFCGVTKND